tara:strand:- start:1768 stop:1899 length:132 start_codon:yes stop_codon:yes gene_type:complete
MLEIIIMLLVGIILAIGLVGMVIFATVTRMNVLDDDGNHLVKK